MASTISSYLPDDYYLLQDFVDRYDLGAKLGAGTFGVVFQARRRTDGCEVAVKFVKKGPHSNYWEKHPVYGRVPNDVIVMDLIQHENIIALLDVFSDDRYVYIVSTFYDSELEPGRADVLLKGPGNPRFSVVPDWRTRKGEVPRR